MTTAANNTAVAGFSAVGNWFIPDNIQRHPLGTIMSVIDPFWGGQEIVYCSFPASTALRVGTCVVYDNAFSATAVPNTANLGQPLAFVLNSVPSVAAVQYGWVVFGGKIPAYSNASVAANAAIGIVAAGQLGANSAGKQVLDSKVQAAATTTVAKSNVVTQNGSPKLLASNTDGWFVGMPISGTGIPASTTVSSLDPDNRTVVMSANATATGAVTVTGTYNDGTSFWNVLYVNRPLAQGAIT